MRVLSGKVFYIRDNKMHKFFSRKPANVNNDTLNILIQPRLTLIDNKHRELITYLNAQRDEILLEPKNDKEIIKRVSAKTSIISSTITTFVQNVLKQPVDIKNNDYSNNIRFQANCLNCLDTPENLTITDRLKVRFDKLIALIDDATVSAKEQATLDAISSLQNGASSSTIGFGKK